MKKRKMVLRPLGVGLGDCYSRSELVALCEQELFASGKRMDTKLLLETLRALDDRPDEEVAPHGTVVWAKIQQRIRPVARAKMPRGKFAILVAVILLLLALAGTCIAWAIKAGVLSFLSISLPGLPQATSPAAESLVQEDLATVIFPHCELHVREAAYDGHQLRIVYSLRDTRPNAVLTEEEKRNSCIAAARLDGIGICDYLTVDGNDIFLDDTFQMSGEREDEMLYYLAANVPEEMPLGDSIRVAMPIGRLQGVRMPRKPEDVVFSLDATAYQVSALYAESTTVLWGNTRVVLQQAEFSPLHGYIEIYTYPLDRALPYDAFKPSLFTMDGQRIQQFWHSYYGVKPDGKRTTIVQYIPVDEWPAQLLLAESLSDGTPNRERCIMLTLIPKGEK